MNKDFNPPRCPNCHSDNVIHKCKSHIPTAAHFKLNGWYCQDCGGGPYHINPADEKMAAKIAKVLL